MTADKIDNVDFSFYSKRMKNHWSVLSRRVAGQKFRQMQTVMECIN